MSLTENKDTLTKGIYGFSNNQDPVPHFFVEEIASLLNESKTSKFLEIAAASLPSSLSQKLKIICGGIFSLIGLVVKGTAETHAVSALVKQADLLEKTYDLYKNNQLNVHIKTHVGTFYTLRVADITKEESNKKVGKALNLSKAKLQSPDLLPRFQETLGTRISTAPSHLQDHDPRLYRHAVQDPKTDDLADFTQTSNRLTTLAFQPPSFLPVLDDDDIVSVGPLINGEAHFNWESVEDSKQCFGGISSEVFDVNNIIWIKCIQSDGLASYENGIEKFERYHKADFGDPRCVVPLKDKWLINQWWFWILIIGGLVAITLLVISLWCKRDEWCFQGCFTEEETEKEKFVVLYHQITEGNLSIHYIKLKAEFLYI